MVALRDSLGRLVGFARYLLNYAQRVCWREPHRKRFIESASSYALHRMRFIVCASSYELWLALSGRALMLGASGGPSSLLCPADNLTVCKLIWKAEYEKKWRIWGDRRKREYEKRIWREHDDHSVRLAGQKSIPTSMRKDAGRRCSATDSVPATDCMNCGE